MIKFLTEVIPLLTFFAVYQIRGSIEQATAYTLIASLFGLIVSYAIERKVNTIALISAVFLSISWGVTTWTGNPDYIKMKPTALYLLFSGILWFSASRKKPALKYMMGETVQLKEDQNWQVLNSRFMIFFLNMAVLNEIVWRHSDESTWVNFKVFGAIPLMIIFVLIQVPYLMKHRKTD